VEEEIEGKDKRTGGIIILSYTELERNASFCCDSLPLKKDCSDSTTSYDD